MPIRTIIASLAAVGALTTMAACSSSGGTKAKDTPTLKTSTTSPAPTTPAPTTSTPAAPVAADAATTAAVTKAYTTFFGGAKDQAALIDDLQNGDKLTAALAAEAKNPTAATLTATVSKVVLENPHVADVTFTLLSSGSVLLADQPGKAVLVDGKWKLAAATFCGLAAAGGPLPPACADTSITAVPTS